MISYRSALLYPLSTLLFAIVATSPAAAQSDASRFIENKGQWDAAARYLLRSDGLDLWITDRGVVYDVRRNEDGIERRAAVFVEFVSSEPSATARGVERVAGHHNYYIGNDPSHWVTNVPLYGEARIEELYDGIDARYYLDGGAPRYDIIVAPGADPSRVRMRFDGASGLALDPEGALLIETPAGEIVQRGLYAYQVRNGRREQVGCEFDIGADRSVWFELGEYDPTRELVIDPVTLVYSTYLGGSGQDQAVSVDAGRDGSASVTGFTASANFPKKNAAQPAMSGTDDIFITGFDPNGALVWSTYLGGSNYDRSSAVGVDNDGSTWVTGLSDSRNFPTKNPIQPTLLGFSDVFITKLDAAGAIIFSTYWGSLGQETGRAIAFDGAGNAYITGQTTSSTFPAVGHTPTPGGERDVFVTKMTSAGTVVYSNRFGGESNDAAYDVVVDGSGNAYLTGETASEDYPLLNALQVSHGGDVNDAFVTKLDATGTMTYSTYLGGELDDAGRGIVVDRDRNILITGLTRSTRFPTNNAVQPAFGGGSGDAFVAKFTVEGALAYSTYLGGELSEAAYAMALDPSGALFIVGGTQSTTFPTHGAMQPALSGESDAFITALDDTGAISYSSYFGGTGNDLWTDVAIEGQGSLFLAGQTTSRDLPTLSPAHASYGGGTSDAIVTRLRYTGASIVVDENPNDQASIRIEALAPNPASKDVRVSYWLERGASVTMEVYTSDGHRVLVPLVGIRCEAGNNVAVFSVDGLAIGRYALRITSNDRSVVTPFVVIN